MKVKTVLRSTTIAVTLAATLSSPAALAESSDFGGLHIGLDLGAVKPYSDVSVSNPKNNFSEQFNFDEPPWVSTLNLNAKYQWVLNEKFTLAVGGRYMRGAYSQHRDLIDTSKNINYDDTRSIYIAPGYALIKDILIYAQLGYAQQRVHHANVDLNLSGPSYGVGAELLLGKHLYSIVEFGQTNYSDQTAIGNGSTVTFRNHTNTSYVGLGYKF